MDQYLTGEELYEDHFSLEQIKKWFQEEREGYRSLTTNKITNKGPFNSSLYSRVDQILSKLFFCNYTYHSTNILKKIRPSSCFFVLKK